MYDSVNLTLLVISCYKISILSLVHLHDVMADSHPVTFYNESKIEIKKNATVACLLNVVGFDHIC